MTNTELCNAVQVPLSEGWGYIWGTSGQVWTKEKQQSATRDMTVKYGSQWIGKRTCDCSGLLVYAYRQFGESIYHGSNTQFREHCRETGRLKNGIRTDGKPLQPGTALFLKNSEGVRHHVGVYTGDGRVIEAAGTRQGVIAGDTLKWDEWGLLKAVTYSDPGTAVPDGVLKRGSAGEGVRLLQAMLGIKQDGIFGPDTQAALKALQTALGIAADGIYGLETRLAMTSDGGSSPEQKPDTPVCLCDRCALCPLRNGKEITA